MEKRKVTPRQTPLEIAESYIDTLTTELTTAKENFSKESRLSVKLANDRLDLIKQLATAQERIIGLEVEISKTGTYVSQEKYNTAQSTIKELIDFGEGFANTNQFWRKKFDKILTQPPESQA